MAIITFIKQEMILRNVISGARQRDNRSGFVVLIPAFLIILEFGV